MPTERLKSPRIRLFVALDLPDEVLDRLVAWQRREFGDIPDARLVPRASLHVTLVFLGYRYEREIERIAALCFERPAGPFELRATEVTGIPPRRPRLYALALEEANATAAGALGAWQQQLSDVLSEAKLYEPEKRPFWAHVTLARGKRDRPLPRLDEPPALPPALRGTWIAPRATLYRSTLRPQGAVYEPLAGMEFATPDLTPPRRVR